MSVSPDGMCARSGRNARPTDRHSVALSDPPRDQGLHRDLNNRRGEDARFLIEHWREERHDKGASPEADRIAYDAGYLTFVPKLQ